MIVSMDAFENPELQEGKEGVESQMGSYGCLSWSGGALLVASIRVASITPNNASSKFSDATIFPSILLCSLVCWGLT